MSHRSSCKLPYRYYGHILMKLNFLDRFSINPQILDFIKTLPAGAELLNDDGRTDRHNEANSRISEFAITQTILCSAHTVCFEWISEQTASISLYSINWLVSVTETECVYCAVRTGSLYII
jgi:hypothetical protein